MAMYAQQGVRTVLVCCTGGEEGDVNNPALKEPGQPFHGLNEAEEKALLARVRPAELDAAAKVIGFHHVEMLGYRDSGMADSPTNNNPACFHMADIDEAVGKLVAVIRRERPQVLVTYNEDQRGYPHPDHLKVHDISVLAFDRAADDEWYPEAGEPWQPTKMYYTLWAKERVMSVHEALIEKYGESPFDEKWLNRQSQDNRITTKLDVAKFMYARTRSLLAHATQVDPTSKWWFGLDDDEMSKVYPWEDWILARSTIGEVQTGVLETDLFVGFSA
jgi:mycothiol S-conjugate amidase